MSKVRNVRVGVRVLLAVGLMAATLICMPSGAGAEGTQLVTVSVHGLDGRALGDTVVTAYRRNIGSWDEQEVATTDRNGDVQFYVPTGTYRVLFEPASPDYQPHYYAGASTFDQADDLHIGAGDHPNLNARMTPTTWIAGRLLDAAGTPMPRSGVRLEKLFPGGHWYPAGTAPTGGDGTYLLGIFGPGFYRVRADVRGEFSPVANSVVVEVDDRGQHFTDKEVRLPPGGGIAGVVRHADGSPFNSAGVDLIRLVEGRIVPDAVGSWAVTDAQGRYRFDDLAAGTYRVVAGNNLDNYTSVVWPGAARFEDARDIVLTAGDNIRLTDIKLRLLPRGRAGPREGQGPTISGEPVVGATLVADPGSWAQVDDMRFSYQWFADGRRIVGATDRMYQPTAADVGAPLVVMVTGTTSRAEPGFAFSEPTDPVRSRQLSRFQPAAAQPLPPSASGFGPGRITGRLTGRGGEPLVGAFVEAVRPEGIHGVEETVSTVPTDAQGSYELVGLPPGGYLVRFHPPLQQPEYDVRTLPEEGTLLIDADQDHRVLDAQLAGAAVIQGRVSLPSGAGAPFAEVHVHQVEAGLYWDDEILTDAHGRYTIFVPPGTYKVRFSRPYYDLAPLNWPTANSPEAGGDVVVHEGQATPGIDGRLRPAARIQGSLRSERTHDPVHAEIATYLLTPEGWVETRYPTFKFLTNRFGRFDLAGLPAGTYRIGFEPFWADYVPEFWNGAATLAGAQDIVVAEGAVITGKDVLIADRLPDWPIRVVNLTRPRIKGAPEVGETLRVTRGEWRPAVTLRFRWFANGQRIKSVSGQAFRVPRRLVGQRIKAKVKAFAKYWQPEVVTTRPTAKVPR